jgi:hypothetical protein
VEAVVGAGEAFVVVGEQICSVLIIGIPSFFYPYP